MRIKILKCENPSIILLLIKILLLLLILIKIIIIIINFININIIIIIIINIIEFIDEIYRWILIHVQSLNISFELNVTNTIEVVYCII